jgi:hypothetical protein
LPPGERQVTLVQVVDSGMKVIDPAVINQQIICCASPLFV